MIITLAKIGKKIYKIKGKISKTKLKKIFKEEALDIADDVMTLLDGDITVDDAFALADLVIGTNLNSKKSRALRELLEKRQDSKITVAKIKRIDKDTIQAELDKLPNGNSCFVRKNSSGKFEIVRKKGANVPKISVTKDGHLYSPNAVKGNHGNNLNSTNEQDGYYIIDKDTGKRVKVGVSGQPLKSDGSSPRAQSQVDKLNAEREREQFTHEVAKKVPSGENARKEILEWEKQEAKKLRKNNEIDPKIHQKP